MKELAKKLGLFVVESKNSTGFTVSGNAANVERLFAGCKRVKAQGNSFEYYTTYDNELAGTIVYTNNTAAAFIGC